MSRHAGIPLLSGPPPPHPGPAQGECRKCGREFTLLFHRQRKCMHCGYGFCSSCTDYQALMPRRGPARGYDIAPVCAFCIEMLNVTALGKAQLRLLPLTKLRRYINAYNISVKNPVDKNDLVDAALAARVGHWISRLIKPFTALPIPPQTQQGSLSHSNEDYYRKHSVPSYSPPGTSNPPSANRNSPVRGSPNVNTNNSSRTNTPEFPRPDLDPNRRERSQETPHGTRTPNTQRSRSTSAPMNPGTAHQTGTRPTSTSGRRSAQRAASATREPSPPHAAPPMPPPPMSTLVTLPRSALSALSVGTLKQILWEARVRIPPGVVEKEEIVDRVWDVVEEERRKDNEGIDDFEFGTHEDDIDGFEEPDREEETVVDMVNPESEHPHASTDRARRAHFDMADEHHHSGSAMDHGLPTSRSTIPQPSTSPPQASTSPHSASKSKPHSNPKPAATSMERSGLCVVCQDEEACIAVVDCGHLAMCRECSDLVLASSRECPLCRTRIVTEGRLLRIFKT